MESFGEVAGKQLRAMTHGERDNQGEGGQSGDAAAADSESTRSTRAAAIGSLSEARSAPPNIT